jgi:hypothetical protein
LLSAQWPLRQIAISATVLTESPAADGNAPFAAQRAFGGINDNNYSTTGDQS